jgi:hypothetical protein
MPRSSSGFGRLFVGFLKRCDLVRRRREFVSQAIDVCTIAGRHVVRDSQFLAQSKMSAGQLPKSHEIHSNGVPQQIEPSFFESQKTSSRTLEMSRWRHRCSVSNCNAHHRPCSLGASARWP